jgi:hypothetical protein
MITRDPDSFSASASESHGWSGACGDAKWACGIAVLLGFLAIVNGTFMLTAPQAWYFAIPGVTTTGPFNQHFIRDIGLIFLLIGAMFLLGAWSPLLRASLWSFAAAWLSGHALFHFWEVAVGICAPSALVRDFGAVTLPALATLWLVYVAIRDQMKSSSSSRRIESLR